MSLIRNLSFDEALKYAYLGDIIYRESDSPLDALTFVYTNDMVKLVYKHLADEDGSLIEPTLEDFDTSATDWGAEGSPQSV